VDRLERRDGRWAIVDRVCVVEWNAESTNLITEEVLALLTDIKERHPRPQRPVLYSPADGNASRHEFVVTVSQKRPWVAPAVGQRASRPRRARASSVGTKRG
jgi:hypothetical protein